jgi:hypothetical protein
MKFLLTAKKLVKKGRTPPAAFCQVLSLQKISTLFYLFHLGTWTKRKCVKVSLSECNFKG